MKSKAKRALPAGAIIPLPNGKATKAKLRKPLSEEATLKVEAEELIVALADAAHDIAVAGVVNDYSKNDFHLYPRHLIALLASDHPLRAWLSEEGEGSWARVAVPWPWRSECDEKSENELRENPFHIIGLLMRKIVDGESAFFDAIAEALREARIAANRKTIAPDALKTRAGRIVASMPHFSSGGDPDWFARIKRPLRKAKAPDAIWKLCKTRHEARQAPPTRREIRDHLEAAGIPCQNLRVVLLRMDLDWLEPGKRGRKA